MCWLICVELRARRIHYTWKKNFRFYHIRNGERTHSHTAETNNLGFRIHFVYNIYSISTSMRVVCRTARGTRALHNRFERTTSPCIAPLCSAYSCDYAKRYARRPTGPRVARDTLLIVATRGSSRQTISRLRIWIYIYIWLNGWKMYEWKSSFIRVYALLVILVYICLRVL